MLVDEKSQRRCEINLVQCNGFCLVRKVSPFQGPMYCIKRAIAVFTRWSCDLQTATLNELNELFEVSLLVRHNRHTRQDNRKRHFGWWSLVVHVDYERKIAVRVDVVQLDQGIMIRCFFKSSLRNQAIALSFRYSIRGAVIVEMAVEIRWCTLCCGHGQLRLCLNMGRLPRG